MTLNRLKMSFLARNVLLFGIYKVLSNRYILTNRFGRLVIYDQEANKEIL